MAYDLHLWVLDACFVVTGDLLILDETFSY